MGRREGGRQQGVKWFFSAENVHAAGLGVTICCLTVPLPARREAITLLSGNNVSVNCCHDSSSYRPPPPLGLWVLKRTNYNVWRHYVYPLLLWLTLCDLSTYMYMYVHFTLHRDWLNGYSMNSFLYCIQFLKLKQFVRLSSLICKKTPTAVGAV